MTEFAFAADGNNPAPILTGIVLYIAISLGLTAFSVLGTVFFQRKIENAAAWSQKRGTRGTLQGILNYAVLIGLILAMGSISAPDLVVGLLFLFLLTVSVCAFVIQAQEVGQRIMLMRGSGNPASAIAMGAVVIELAFLIPILGQILWVLLLARGLGACVVSLRHSAES